MCPEAYAIAIVRNIPKATRHCPLWPFTALSPLYSEAQGSY